MVATPGSRTYNFDANMLLADNAAALTATGYAQAAGADGMLDLGGNQGVTPKQQARMDAMLVVDVTALNIATGDEDYRLVTAFSNDPLFGAGNVQQGPSQVLGKGAHLDVPNGVDSVIGRVELPFSNEILGVIYEYVKLYAVVAGTNPSISFQAFVAPLQFK